MHLEYAYHGNGTGRSSFGRRVVHGRRVVGVMADHHKQVLEVDTTQSQTNNGGNCSPGSEREMGHGHEK